MNRNEGNRAKLKALVELLGISITAVAEVAGVSRCLVSRVLNEGIAGDGVWAELEKRFAELVSKKQRAFFEVEAVEVEQVQKAVEALKKVA